MTRYFEDVSVGDRHFAGSVEVTEPEVLAFARAFDPQPIHLDAEAAVRSGYDGIIASGWHTAALVMRLIATARPLGDTEVLGLAVENLRWSLPVRPGDTLSVDMEVVYAAPSQSKPRFGIVKYLITTRNQHGETVMTHLPVCWVPRRS
ncbi:MAG TPA: MaoC family dehydratase [Bryobacteraceae bacterium]